MRKSRLVKDTAKCAPPIGQTQNKCVSSLIFDPVTRITRIGLCVNVVMMAARGAWAMVAPRRPLKSRPRNREKEKCTNTCTHTQEDKDVRLRTLVLTRKLITSVSKIKRVLRRTTQVMCCSVLQCVAVCCSVLQCVAVSHSHE